MRLIFGIICTFCCLTQLFALPAKLPYHTTFNGDIYLFRAGYTNMMDYYLRALNLDYQLLCERNGEPADGQTRNVERCFDDYLYTVLYRCHSKLAEVELLGMRRDGKCSSIDNEVLVGAQEAWSGGKTKKNFDEIDKTSASFGHLNQLI